MSAFLCDDCHLSALASYYCANNPAAASQQTVLETLRSANTQSLNACYGKRLKNPENAPQLCQVCCGSQKSYIQIIKAARCYQYQSCEYAGWEASEARQVVDFIQDHALRSLARLGGPKTIEALQRSEVYDRAPWRWQRCARKA